jgi:1-phosphatidylinositol-4-phosphate 5-kinase
VTSEEERFLRKIGYCYYNHMKQNPNSLIVRFFGLHKVRLAPEQRYISVVVMENIFYNRFQLKMHSIYDLKGSTVNRRALKGGKSKETYHGTLKDLDLDQTIFIGAEAKVLLKEQLEHDVAFLTRCGIMDYSLLLGIHDHSGDRPRRFESESLDFGGSRGDTIVDVNLGNGHGRTSLSSLATSPGALDRHRRPAPSLASDVEGSSMQDKQLQPHVPWFRRDMGGLRSYSPFHPCASCEQQTDGREASTIITEYQGVAAQNLPTATYFFGVVDILQEYNIRKKAEHLWKTKVMCQDKRELSAVRHHEYGERFLRAMDRIFQ